MNFSVTQFGKPLDSSSYSWNETTKTFYSNEWNLVLDFSGMDGVRFKTGGECTFKTGNNCTFDTYSYCSFNTGDSCTFNTGIECVFKTGASCIIECGETCVFDVGENCSLTYSSRGRTFFENHKLKSNKLVLLLKDVHLKSLLGQIQDDEFPIFWWKEDNKIMIKVGCQIHSLETWKKNYQQIAIFNGFPENLIPEYLSHLNTIESSILKPHSH